MSNITQDTDESIFDLCQQDNDNRSPVLASNIIKPQEIKQTRETTAFIPEAKGAHLLSCLPFACNITCTQHLGYTIHQSDQYYHELEKLDIVLSPKSCLFIQCKFLLNGLDVLEYPSTWIKDTLDKIMEICGFIPSTSGDDTLFCYTIKKAFVTTPLSYLLVDKSASHGVLSQIDLIFDWSAANRAKEFQCAWKRKIVHHPQINDYMTQALNLVLLKKTFYFYPLIFNNAHVKRLSQTVVYIPHIAHSLQKVLNTSKATMSVDNHAFSENFEQKLKMIHKNTRVMIQQTESVRDTLTLGMYYSVKHDNQPNPPTNAKNLAVDPPNALWTVSLLWSSSI